MARRLIRKQTFAWLVIAEQTRFLLVLGVNRRVARRDAEGLEHHVGAETLLAFAHSWSQGVNRVALVAGA